MNNLIQSVNWQFIIAIVAIAISIYSIYLQRKHSTLAHKPIPVIVKYNYSDHISVKIWNKGTGPLIIKSIKIGEFNNLVDILPDQTKNLKFVEYINDFRERAITSNDCLNMLEFKIRHDENDKPINAYDIAIKTIKNELHEKKIVLNYTDIFNNSKEYTSIPMNFRDAKDELINIEKG